MTEQIGEFSGSFGEAIRQGLALPSGAALLWNKTVEDLGASSTVLIGGGVREDCRDVSDALDSEDYRIVHAQDGGEVFSLSRAQEIDLLILDASLPDGFGVCRKIKEIAAAKLTPVLMLLPEEDVALQIRALDCGADELVARPFHPDLLRTRVRSMIRHKTVLNQLEQSETILFALAQAIEKKDHGMGDHCERIARFSVALGMSIGLPRQHLLALYRGGYLHDIGKVAIPDAILFKPGRLDAAEWDVMKTHTLKGEEICRSLKSLAPVLPIIRSHHERWDGSGYPDRLDGARIPLLARILQIADVYDALTSARSYKEPLEPGDALAIMQAETERGWRDPVLMKAFRELHDTAVLRAVGAKHECKDLDGVRASLRNLSRQLAKGGRAERSAYRREGVLEIGQEIPPVLDAYGDPD
jgi:putative two-component system response regulator